MKLYVVINHYLVNSEVCTLALHAIESFKATSDATIISVDDCSPIFIPEIEALSDVYIQKETNGGFAESANDGFRWILENEPDNCYIAYSNNDIAVYDGWFETLKQAMEEHKADMVGGLGHRVMPVPENMWNDLSIGGLYRDWMFPGGFYMTTKEFFEDVGLYDEGYKHGGVEDIDLFWRAKQAGKRLVITPRVRYWHKEGATRYSSSEEQKQSVAIKENEAYFESKWGFHPIKHLNGKILIDERINL